MHEYSLLLVPQRSPHSLLFSYAPNARSPHNESDLKSHRYYENRDHCHCDRERIRRSEAGRAG
jgi:hypothetical protein